MSVSVLERKFQRQKGQPLCYEPRKDGSFIKHKKHAIVEFSFRILCLNCGKTFEEFKMPKFNMKKIIILQTQKTEKTMIDRMAFIYRTQEDQELALARKLRVYNRTKDRNLAHEIQALTAVLDQSSNRANNRIRSMTKDSKTAAKPSKKSPSKKTTAKKAAPSKKESKINKAPVKVKPLTATLKSKTCPKCKRNRSIDNFGKRVYKGKTYYQSRCTECR